MSISQLLSELAQQGIKLSASGDQLQIKAPKGALRPELRDRIAENKAVILALLRQDPTERRAIALAPAVLAPADRYQPFPLTDIQRAYWLGRTGAFTVPTGIHLYHEYDCVDLDVERLNRGFRRLVERHDMLRARTLSEALQVVEPEIKSDIEVIDLSGLAPDEREERLAAMRDTMSHRVYDTGRSPLHHIVAVRVDDRRTRLIVSIDLINVDGGSLAILFKEWMRLYDSPDASLPALSLSYRDYVLALKAQRQLESYQRSLDYWKQRALDLSPAPALPMAVDPATLPAVRFEHLEARLPPASWGRLQQRAKAAQVTTSIVFLTAYAETIARFSASPRFTLNVTLFNRLPVHAEVNDIIGDFSSMLLLSIDASAGRSFEERALQIQQQLWDAMEHREVSGIEVQREVARIWQDHQGALFPVVFTSMQNQRSDGYDALTRLGELVYSLTQTPQLLLDHQLFERNGDAMVVWDIVSGVYPEGLIRDMFQAYTGLLLQLAEEDAPWKEGSIDLLPEGQRARRVAINATDEPLPEDLIHELFMRQADAAPDRAAVITSSRVITYAALDRLSNQLAHELRALGVGPDTLVPIVMEKGWEQIVAVFGVLKAGGAYVPLDAAGSEERVGRMIRDSEARVVLTQVKFAAGVAREGLRVLAVDERATRAGDDRRLASVQGPRNLAYVLYTSGSTGQPKGAMIEHRAVTNRMTDTATRFGLGPEDRMLALTALHHDMSVLDMLCTLGVVGGAIVLPDADKTRDPGHWAELIKEHRVTLWNSVPAFMQMFVEHMEGRAEQAQGIQNSLRLVMLGGDFIPLDLPDRLRALIPGALVVSVGGPTETSIMDIYYPIDQVDPTWKSIPYGRPMRGTRYHVLNEQLRECPDWVSGELHIGGVGVGRGYWRDEERTQERFISHPETGERLYKSGDMGRWRPDGNLEILGRKDFQIKIRGYRIEPAEVEAAIRQHPDVRDAVVIAVGDSGVNRRLHAYVVKRTRAGSPAVDGELPIGQAGTMNAAERAQFKLARHGVRKDLGGEPRVALGRPEQGDALLDIYARRRSIRTFLMEPIPLADFGRFLSCLTHVDPEGAALPKYLYPSGGSLYPVQTYVYVKPGRIEGVQGGFYYHDPRDNQIGKLSDQSMDRGAHVSWNVDVFEQSAFVLLFVGKLDAIEPLYGSSARDLCLVEAGYMGQLLMERAPSSGLGVCPLGAIDFERFRSALRVDPSSVFVHGMLGGKADPAVFTVTALGQASSPGHAPSASGKDLSEQLKGSLRQKLPEYMIPSAFIEIDALPLSSNGKLDRRALLSLTVKPPASPAEEALPRNALEERLIAVVREVVGLSDIRVDQNFFDAGATSVHVVIMTRRLREILGREIAVTEMFRSPNIRALASALSAKEPEATSLDKAQDRAEARRRARSRR